MQPWVVAEMDGRILNCHCNCVAGLGETCTHAAALLISIEAMVKMRDAKTVTQEKAYWLLPSAMKKVDYKECKDINFTSAKSMKKNLDSNISFVSHENTKKQAKHLEKKCPDIPAPSDEELHTLFSNLHTGGAKSAILSVIEPFSENFVPKLSSDDFPQILTALRDEHTFSMNYSDLIIHCQQVARGISVTQSQAQAVEKSTREQAHSKAWFRFRAGRITASKMKAVCCTNPAQPSQSLIKSICYPEAGAFISPATVWGCTHEKHARDMFGEKISSLHENVKIYDAGLFINPEFPYIGASPDAIMSCDCCGTSVVEIKCPFCTRHKEIVDACQEKKFCLNKANDGTVQLDHKHAYFYQVQTQLGVCKCEVAHFVVWTEKELHHEEIAFDDLFWTKITEESQHIFLNAILPELVGKFFSRPPQKGTWITQGSSKESNTADADTDLYGKISCYCKQPEFQKMMACDNPECPIKWFHYKCVGLKCTPKRRWFCPSCRKLPEIHSKKRKSK